VGCTSHPDSTPCPLAPPVLTQRSLRMPAISPPPPPARLQRSPSSFNFTSYTGVLVRGASPAAPRPHAPAGPGAPQEPSAASDGERDAAGVRVRAALADAMVGEGNRALVAAAPVTLVLLARTRFTPADVDAVVEMERRAGRTTRYLRGLRFDLMSAVSPGGCDAAGQVAGWGSQGGAAAAAWSAAVGGVRSVLSQAAPVVTAAGLATTLPPLPTRDPLIAWSYKSAMAAAQTYMLACAAAGLATHPMEGFDASRVIAAVGVPPHARASLAVPVVIPTGWRAAAAAGPPSPSPRPALSAVFADTQWSSPWPSDRAGL
jgi:nitroreductase